ncbi:hypothetical protein FQZ97_891550 [compost metagenome]
MGPCPGQSGQVPQFRRPHSGQLGRCDGSADLRLQPDPGGLQGGLFALSDRRRQAAGGGLVAQAQAGPAQCRDGALVAAFCIPEPSARPPGGDRADLGSAASDHRHLRSAQRDDDDHPRHLSAGQCADRQGGSRRAGEGAALYRGYCRVADGCRRLAPVPQYPLAGYLPALSRFPWAERERGVRQCLA